MRKVLISSNIWKNLIVHKTKKHKWINLRVLSPTQKLMTKKPFENFIKFLKENVKEKVVSFDLSYVKFNSDPKTILSHILDSFPNLKELSIMHGRFYCNQTSFIREMPSYPSLEKLNISFLPKLFSDNDFEKLLISCLPNLEFLSMQKTYSKQYINFSNLKFLKFLDISFSISSIDQRQVLPESLELVFARSDSYTFNFGTNHILTQEFYVKLT